MQPILDRVKGAIEDVRVEGGYSFILNADEGSAIVAMDKNLDLTDRVLAQAACRRAHARQAGDAARARRRDPSGLRVPDSAVD